MTSFDIYVCVCIFFSHHRIFFSYLLFSEKKKIFFLLLLKKIFLWLCQVLVAVCGLFSCGMWTLHCCKCDLVPWLESEPRPPASGASQPLGHQGSLGVPYSFVLLITCSPKTLFIWFSLWLRSSVSSFPLVSSPLPVTDSSPHLP